MTTPNLFALMGRLEELMQNEKRYLALRNNHGVRFGTRGVFSGSELDKACDKLIEEQGDIQDE